MKINISACQFKVEKVSTFLEFQNQVEDLISQVPVDSDYILFPELFTIGLAATHEGMDETSVIKIAEYANQYKLLFRTISKRGSK